MNPNLVSFLESPAGVKELGKRARMKASEIVAAERRKLEIVEFAAILVGGTEDKPFGLAVEAEAIVELILSLPQKQGDAVMTILDHTLNKAIDFAEHGRFGHGFGVKPLLPENFGKYLRQWIDGGKTVETWFEANVEVGKMNDFDLREFRSEKEGA